MANERFKILFKKLLIYLILAAFAYTFFVDTRLSNRLNNHIGHISEKLSEIGERLSGIETFLRGELK